MRIETERLYLRHFDIEKDLEAYADIMGEYEVGRWLPKGEGHTLEETERFMNYMVKHWEKYNYGIWAVVDKETDCLLGHCGLNFIKDISETEVLYVFGKHARGKGYATEAAMASLKYGFEEIGLDHIIALSKPLNKASINVIEKLGLKFVKDMELFKMEVKYFSITKDEYKSINK